tara:strand:+ start:2551 stop:2967 length:417 start_codon:yes stop_codon:yes gene_type:complete
MSTLLIGSDGDASLPTGYKAVLNTFSATLTRTTQVLTGFGDSGARRKASGVLDITGSAGGTPYHNASTSSPLGIAGSAAGGSITLTFGTGTPSGSTLVFDAVFNSVAFAATQDGAQTVTFNFEMNDQNGPDVVWDESP